MFARSVLSRFHRRGTAPVLGELSQGQRRFWEACMHREAGRIVETPVEARAGFLDRPVLVVLVVSTVLVVGALALTYFGFWGS